ncbi:MAG: hypothetical protein WC254_02985 [Candidatus Woesearchaeota archaeon]|jgi:hypothetical protein
MSILDLRNPEIAFLEDLVDDLTGIFHVIAHTDEGNETYIRESQQYIRKRYDSYLDSCRTYESYKIVFAYDVLQRLLEGNPTPVEIIDQCEEALYEYLMEGIEPEDFVEENLEQWAGPFSDYFLEQ